VVLRFRSRGRAARGRDHLAPTQSLEKHADGSLTWSARVSGTLEILPWILGWGRRRGGPGAQRAAATRVAGTVLRAAARYPRA